jgi:hypothetical protein
MAFAAPGGRGEPDGSLGPPASPSGRRRSFAASGGSVRGCEAFHGLRSPRRADFRANAADKASASACTVRDPHGSRWIGGSSRSVRRPCLSDETSAGLRRVGLGHSLRQRSRQSVCFGLHCSRSSRQPVDRRKFEEREATLPQRRDFCRPPAGWAWPLVTPSQPTKRLLRLAVAEQSPAPRVVRSSEPVDRRKLEEREATLPQRRDFCRPPAGWAWSPVTPARPLAPSPDVSRETKSGTPATAAGCRRALSATMPGPKSIHRRAPR